MSRACRSSWLRRACFLNRVKSGPARELARRAMAQCHREADQRRVLRHVVAEFMESLPPTPSLNDFAEALAAVAEFTALGRSPVLFDQGGEIEYAPALPKPVVIRLF